MKNLSIKVNRPTGEFIKDWTSIARFSGFSKEINGGLGECILELGVMFDYQGSELEVGNVVEIYISDKETLIDGFKKIYSGYISMIEGYVDGGKEGVLVHLLGHYTRLSTDYLKNGSQTTLYSDSTDGLTVTSPGDEAEIGLVVRAVIDRYIAETSSSKISYTLSSIPEIGQSILYTLSVKTYRECLDKLISMYPSNYFYYIDENGILTIKEKSSTPDHTFEFKKHFKSIKIQRGMEKIRNNILIWNGEDSGVYNNYNDAASILKYGRRSEYQEDSGIADDSSADKIGSKFIAENKDPDVKVICELIDDNIDEENGYDIESVNPGNTCRFVGFDSSLSDILKDNMLITRVDYELDKITLTVEITKSGIINWQNKTTKEVNDLKSYGVPESYT